MDRQFPSIPSNAKLRARVVTGRGLTTLVTLVALLLTSQVNAQSVREIDRVTQDLLIQIHDKKGLAEEHLARMPDQVSQEVNYIMEDFNDSLAIKVQKRFSVHYDNVDETLNSISLPPEIGNLELVWKQLKAGTYDSHDLDRLVDDFIDRAHRSLGRHREELSKFMEIQIDSFLTENLNRAHENIWRPYAKIPGLYFPSLQIPNLPPPPLPVLLDASPGTESSHRGSFAFTGGAILLLRKLPSQIAAQIPDRIKQKLKKKLLGKVAAKGASVGASGPLAPAIGLILLGIEAWDASQAKAELERELRDGYLKSYKAAFSSHIMLNEGVVDGEPSVRAKLREIVENSLEGWTTHCRLEVERMLEAAEVASLSQNVGTYIQNELGKGRSSRAIVEDLVAVQSAYPLKMVRDARFQDLLETLQSNDSLDDRQFRHLAHQLGPQLLREYEQHRGELFVAAKLLGVSVFLEFIRSAENLDWYAIRTTFSTYGTDLTESARRGLLLAIQENVGQPGVPHNTLSNIYRHSDFFRELVQVLQEDREKLYRLFGDTSLIAMIRRVMDENQDAARSFVDQWTIQAWERYRGREGRLDALLAVAEYRLTHL